MNVKQAAVVAVIRKGGTIDEAATHVGVNVHTLRRWLSTGRKNPDGPYGHFAGLVDRLKDEPKGPEEHARAFIVALSAFLVSGSDEDGNAMVATAHRIPDSLRYQVMSDLGTHFLVGVVRRMDTDAGADALPAAIEDMFREVDAVNSLRQTKTRGKT